MESTILKFKKGENGTIISFKKEDDKSIIVLADKMSHVDEYINKNLDLLYIVELIKTKKGNYIATSAEPVRGEIVWNEKDFTVICKYNSGKEFVYSLYDVDKKQFISTMISKYFGVENRLDLIKDFENAVDFIKSVFLQTTDVNVLKHDLQQYHYHKKDDKNQQANIILFYIYDDKLNIVVKMIKSVDVFVFNKKSQQFILKPNISYFNLISNKFDIKDFNDLYKFEYNVMPGLNNTIKTLIKKDVLLRKTFIKDLIFDLPQ